MKKMNLSAESIQKLSGCHPDLMRVMVRASRVTSVCVRRGLAEAGETPDPMAKDRRRPSDAAVAGPDGAVLPIEPPALLALPESEQNKIRAHVRNVARWYYLGGVVMGVAETLHDQSAIERPVVWMGVEATSSSGLSRFERG